jgi:chromosome segregation ATPase
MSKDKTIAAIRKELEELKNVQDEAVSYVQTIRNEEENLKKIRTEIDGLRGLINDVNQKGKKIEKYAQIINESDQKLKTLDLLSEDINVKLENLKTQEGAIEQATKKADRLQFSIPEAEARIKELTARIDQANQIEKRLLNLLPKK